MTSSNSTPKPCSVLGCGKKLIARNLCAMHYYRLTNNGDTSTVKHIKGNDRARFDSKIERIPFAVCHYWVGAIDSGGYGHLSIGGVPTRAHRYAYSIERGQIPTGAHIRHTCDNPICVNPDHLKLGTHNDNMQDKVARQRQSRGESSGMARLTEEAVREIRASSEYNYVLAEKYGVATPTVQQARTGKTWRHI